MKTATLLLDESAGWRCRHSRPGFFFSGGGNKNSAISDQRKTAARKNLGSFAGWTVANYLPCHDRPRARSSRSQEPLDGQDAWDALMIWIDARLAPASVASEEVGDSLFQPISEL